MQGKNELTFCDSLVQRMPLEKMLGLRKTTSVWLVEAFGKLEHTWERLGNALGSLTDSL